MAAPGPNRPSHCQAAQRRRVTHFNSRHRALNAFRVESAIAIAIFGYHHEHAQHSPSHRGAPPHPERSHHCKTIVTLYFLNMLTHIRWVVRDGSVRRDLRQKGSNARAVVPRLEPRRPEDRGDSCTLHKALHDRGKLPRYEGPPLWPRRYARRVGSPDRRDRLLLVCALSQALLTLLGAACERTGLDRRLKANTSKKRTHSLFRQGLFWYSAIPTMQGEWFEPLMIAFEEILREHAGFTAIFANI